MHVLTVWAFGPRQMNLQPVVLTFPFSPLIAFWDLLICKFGTTGDKLLYNVAFYEGKNWHVEQPTSDNQTYMNTLHIEQKKPHMINMWNNL